MTSGPSPASPEPRDGHAPVLTVDGSPLQARWRDQLSALRVDRGLGLVGRATLRFLDNGFAMSSSEVFALGTAVTISTYGTDQSLLEGTVTSVTLDASERACELVVVVDDAAVRLMQPAKPSGTAKVKGADVVSRLASAQGLSADIEAGALGAQVHDYLFQIGSGLAYLEAMCQRTGAVWWVEGTSLKVRKPDSSSGDAKLVLGQDLVTFSVKATTAPPSAFEVRGWDIVQKTSVVSQAAVKQALSSTESRFARGAAGREGDTSSASYTLVRESAPVTQDEAATVAKARARDAAGSAVVARGTCLGAGGLAPAVDLTVEGVGPASGTYHVTRVEHVYGPQGFRTQFTAGPLRPTGLVDTLGPAPVDAGMRMEGVVVAIVTNNNDPENMGRVKVKIPDLADAVESTWARVATVGAGASRGVFFLPEVNDEVLIAFEAGDTRRPLVLGGLYGGKSASPLKSADAVKGSDVAKRQIVSRLGHLIELSDGKEPGEKHVVLSNADGQTIRLGSDKVTLDSAGKPIEIIGAQGGSIKVDANGGVTIEGTKIVLKSAQGPVEVQGTQVTVKGSGPVSVESQANLTVKGAMTSVSASAVAEIKGSLVKIN